MEMNLTEVGLDYHRSGDKRHGTETNFNTWHSLPNFVARAPTNFLVLMWS